MPAMVSRTPWRRLCSSRVPTICSSRPICWPRVGWAQAEVVVTLLLAWLDEVGVRAAAAEVMGSEETGPHLIDVENLASTASPDWRKKGLQMVVIGLGAAAVGFPIGGLFHAAGA
jgi:hypothetical protein